MIEDAHWIDEVSESMLADLTVISTETAFTSAVNRLRRASGSMLGSFTSGSAMPTRSSKSAKSSGSASRTWA